MNRITNSQRLMRKKKLGVVENQKSDVSTDVIPCIKTEPRYSRNVNQPEDGEKSNDMRKVVSFQPQVLERTRSYAEVVKDNYNRPEERKKKYSLIDIYPKVKT